MNITNIDYLWILKYFVNLSKEYIILSRNFGKNTLLIEVHKGRCFAYPQKYKYPHNLPNLFGNYG